MDLPALDRLDVAGRRVLVRCDLNTPVAQVGGRLEVVDDFRIRATVPLLIELFARGASVVACTHFGRPKGRVVAQYSVEPVRRRLDDLCPGVDLMENLRFSPGEEANDPGFGALLVDGVDLYVNEAFGSSHRAHASIMVPPTLRPSAAGPNLVREVGALSRLLESPRRPFVAVVGGAKVADKLGVMRSLVELADTVVVGGGMAYTFLAAQGHTVGASLFDAQRVAECAELLATGRVLVPIDGRGLASGEAFGRDGGPGAVIDFGRDVPDGVVGLDIGLASADAFALAHAEARSILWNGPMGVF
ncbi:MAG: phosphoglycerate kinase, partial [Acidimicrobiales bacterium]